MTLEVAKNNFDHLFNLWLEEYLNKQLQDSNVSAQLLNSQKYSLMSGGKRFRPLLCYLVFRNFSEDFKKIKNLCLALEMVHTYSLIHDDLPCMDNDDFRRGKPTNHKVFSEELALLAGDGLLTDAFALVASDEHISHQQRVKIIYYLSQKSGSAGMVSGQVMDMSASNAMDIQTLSKIHKLKTANLIEAAAYSASVIGCDNEEKQKKIAEFAAHLGMAFQIKDDILDMNDKEQNFKSYVGVLGEEKANSELQKHTDAALMILDLIEKNKFSDLKELINFNLTREK